MAPNYKQEIIQSISNKNILKFTDLLIQNNTNRNMTNLTARNNTEYYKQKCIEMYRIIRTIKF